MYNKEQIRESISKVRKFNRTVEKKKLHESKVWELKELYDEFMSINRWLFDAMEEYHFRNYKNAVELSKTKKELDHLLKLCLLYLGRQLTEILRIA